MTAFVEILLAELVRIREREYEAQRGEKVNLRSGRWDREKER